MAVLYFVTPTKKNDTKKLIVYFITCPQEFQIVYLKILDTLKGKSDVFHTVGHVYSCHLVFVAQVHLPKVNYKIIGLEIYKCNTKYSGNRNSVC